MSREVTFLPPTFFFFFFSSRRLEEVEEKGSAERAAEEADKLKWKVEPADEGTGALHFALLCICVRTFPPAIALLLRLLTPERPADD